MIRKLGFIGVGKWARVLRNAFDALGCEVVGHERRMQAAAAGETEGFGPRLSLHRMIDSGADAFVIVAPPHVTTAYAIDCNRLGIPCLATKPLMLTHAPDGPGRISVDLWRLWIPAWRRFVGLSLRGGLDGIDIHMSGDGPVRDFSPLLDYGPHALAWAFDLGLGDDVGGSTDERPGSVTARIVADNPVPMRIHFGNRMTEERPLNRSVKLSLGDESLTLAEDSGRHFTFSRGDSRYVPTRVALENFCRAFLDGTDQKTLDYSIRAMRILQRL